MENARECYHCAARHPGLSVPFPVWRGSRLAQSEIVERFAARMAALGLSVGPVEGEWWQASRFPLNDDCISLTLDGKPCVRRPMCEVAGGDVGSLRWALEPHSFCHALGDYVVMFSAMPTAPQETIVTCKWFVHKDAVEGFDYTVEGLTRLWTETNLQDRDLAENNQRGVNGRGCRPGPYSEEAEYLVIRLVNWYCAQARRYLDESADGTRGSKARLVTGRKTRLAS
jgi:Rieske 2Fe-2S family protein